MWLTRKGGGKLKRLDYSHILRLRHVKIFFVVVQVAAFCGTLEKDLSDRKKTAEVDVGDLSTSSYASMFESEAERRMKIVPTAFYQSAPHLLFDANCVSDFVGWV